MVTRNLSKDRRHDPFDSFSVSLVYAGDVYMIRSSMVQFSDSLQDKLSHALGVSYC